MLSNRGKYLLEYSILVFITFSSLILLGETRIDFYVSLYIVEYFVLTLLHSPFGPVIEKRLAKLSYILFSIFVVIVTYRVLEILYPELIHGIFK